MTDFTSLGLAEPVMRALVHLGYDTPTPIQEQAIPDVLKGRDLMGIAQTGTGKTAAFSLPTLHHIVTEERDPPKRGARALILAPTRELAAQIAESVREYGRSIPTLRVACIFGGVPISRQIKQLVRGNDVLIATPGRLIDLVDRKDVRLDDVEILILDEADQMMDMGFIHALRKIVPLLPTDRQTLFFSATMSPAIKKLAGQFLDDPVRVSVTPPNTTAEKVTQSLTFVDKREKQDLLALTLLDHAINRALVFTRTKHGADRVVKRLAGIGLEAVAIHGNKSQSQRRRALDAFREGRIRFLIATDIAARGIDIDGVSHVINFEIPNVPEQYVHRIGRTARAGTEGRAIAFVADDERAYLKDIQKLLKTTITVEPLPENFNAKAKALKSRPALPKPTKPGQPAHKAGQASDKAQNKKTEGRRPKRRKRPRTAEEELTQEPQKASPRNAGGGFKRKPRRPRNGDEAPRRRKDKHRPHEESGRTATGTSQPTDKPAHKKSGHKQKRRAHKGPERERRADDGERSAQSRERKGPPRGGRNPHKGHKAGGDKPHKGPQGRKPSRGRRS